MQPFAIRGVAARKRPGCKRPLADVHAAAIVVAMTIMSLIIGGALCGVLTGVLIAPLKVGCTALLVVPVAMVGYIAFWQSQHPDLIRSTSSLEYVFGPLWPSLGAISGFLVGGLARFAVARIKRKVR